MHAAADDDEQRCSTAAHIINDDGIDHNGAKRRRGEER